MQRSTPALARLSLAARVTVLLIAAALLLTAVAAIAAASADQNSDQIDVIFNDIAPLRTDSQQVLVAMLDQETGVRGYALNGAADSLAPYSDGLSRQKALVADMMSHARRYRNIGADVQAVDQQAALWQQSVAGPAIAQVRAGDSGAARDIINSAGTARFDQVRAAIAKLQQEVMSIRNAAVSRLKRSNRQIVSELVVAAAIVIVAGLVLIWLLRRLVTKPVGDLAGSVRRVADGDFNHLIDMSGPPELASLAQDVDNMRKRIVDDLRVVEHANESVERANRQLQQHTAELARSNTDLEQFAYVASHDLQEPLRKVASFCQLLQRRYAGALDERADQYIAFAVDGAHRMQRLINDLLEFSRIGRAGQTMVPVDLGAIVRTIAQSFDSTVTATGGRITTTDLPVVMGVDELLTALMTNLISNAVKFRRSGEPVRIDVSGRTVDGDWEITCADNGIGIEPTQAERIFVIFQRLHTRDLYPGTGIGLAIAKRIVEYHGGRIWAEPNTAIEAAMAGSDVVSSHVAGNDAVGGRRVGSDTAGSDVVGSRGVGSSGAGSDVAGSAAGPTPSFRMVIRFTLPKTPIAVLQPEIELAAPGS